MRMQLSNLYLVIIASYIGIGSAGCELNKAGADNQQSFEVGQNKAQQESALENNARQNAQAKAVQSLVLRSETYTSRLEASGKTLAAKESYLSCAVPGLIKEILVVRGQQVKKGQVLLRLDQHGFRLGVLQAQASLDSAKAAAGQLATEVTRFQQLLASGATPPATIDDLQAKNKMAQAQVRMAQAALQQAEKALRDAELRAPYNGVISEILKEKGEQAPAMPPTMLMKIIDTSKLEVQAFMPEEAGRYVYPGTRAEVTVESAGAVAQGEVAYVSNAIHPGGRTFEVRIRIDNRNGQIKAGAFARVRLEKEKRDKAILIPIASIGRDEQNHPYVFIAESGIARKVMVTLGSLQGSRALVVSGLSAGKTLITSNMGGLVDGQPVLVAQ